MKDTASREDEELELTGGTKRECWTRRQLEKRGRSAIKIEVVN